MIIEKAFTENKSLPFKKVGDLLYHEGPLLSLFVDDHSNMILYKWVDIDVNSHHWLITSISSKELLHFFKRELSLLEYYNKCEEKVIAEVCENLEVKKIKAIKDLPKEYLPGEKSFFTANVYTLFAVAMQSIFTNGLAIINADKISLFDTLGFTVTYQSNKKGMKTTLAREKDIKYIKRK